MPENRLMRQSAVRKELCIQRLTRTDMALQPDDMIIRKNAYASRVKDDLVFFDEAAGQYFATGTVGADIWELIEAPCSLRAICAALMERYEVDDATCQAEATRFVEELIAAGLAERQ
jgi:hypothetical protein